MTVRCKHVKLLSLVRIKISAVLNDDDAPHLKGFDLEKIPKLLQLLDEAIVETHAAIPREDKRRGLDPVAMARLSVHEIQTTQALLQQAGYKERKLEGCPCELEKHDSDLNAMTKRIAEALSEEGINMHNLGGLARATLALHKGLGLVPVQADDGIDWESFDLEQLHYLHAVVSKAEGRAMSPPVGGISCPVCGYSAGGAGADSTRRNCPMGCSPLSEARAEERIREAIRVEQARCDRFYKLQVEYAEEQFQLENSSPSPRKQKRVPMRPPEGAY